VEVTHLQIYDVLLIKPEIHRDHRGYVFESYQGRHYSEIGLTAPFVQDVHSHSTFGVIRGLHAQPGMGKLVRVVHGAIFDVAVDIRPSSPTFSKWVGEVLTSKNHHQLWIPDGFAHGLMALTPTADVSYKMTKFYSPTEEIKIRWDDEDIGVEWVNWARTGPMYEIYDRSFSPIVSSVDATSPTLSTTLQKLKASFP
jgi:dTDP-4-dehydrorhamnose 3,5-epimerase